LALRLPPDSATLSFTIRPSLCHGAWNVSGITPEFAAVGAGKSIYLGDPLHSETVACPAVVAGAIKLGANRLISESDSTVVKALNRDEHHRSKIYGRFDSTS
jgi:hypothetical protein